MFKAMPYRINGIILWAVEREGGWIERYCNSKADANMRCDKLNFKEQP